MMAGNPNWWSINNMHPQSHQHLPHESSPQYLYDDSSLIDPQHPTQEYPRSWSQLLIGGLTNDPEVTLADNPSYQDKKLDHQNWEGHILKPCLRGVNNSDVKLENSLIYGGVNSNLYDEFQVGTKSWSQIIIPNSSTCLTTGLFNFSTNNCKLDLRNQLPQTSSECNSLKTASVAKKPKIQQSTTQTSMKVRKEKLGDRITALHQLVSPFGKTDTASVLSESVSYIRFLQAQIQALSSPYLGNVASRSMGHQQSFDSQDQPKDLRSRGLCLVPISCTIHVASDNGADYWSLAPAPVLSPVRGF